VRVAIVGAGEHLDGLEALGDTLALDVLELDRPHVVAFDDPAARAAVVRASHLATRCGATLVADGVERADQVQTLRGLGCTVAQGRHFAPASTAATIDRLLAVDALGELTA
ncbi:MAG: EAL domain-containing protein, partial [Solirubrobacterales bacterium]|nr:EAL domain-containing protein [Solirubrobacterales bacterium]